MDGWVDGLTQDSSLTCLGPWAGCDLSFSVYMFISFSSLAGFSFMTVEAFKDRETDQSTSKIVRNNKVLWL